MGFICRIKFPTFRHGIVHPDKFYLAILLYLTIGSLAYAQTVILDEDFEDQDLIQNPEWTGDLNDFTFIQENGNTFLRLDAEPDPSRSQIRTPGALSHGTWKFFIRQDLTPSNLNRTFVFLMADREDLNYLDGSSVNGYALRVGDNESPRRFKLIRFTNGNQTEILASSTEIAANQGYQIKITRSENGEWELLVAEGYGSNPVPVAAPVTDTTHRTSAYFGLLLRYSSGNVANFYFDDFRIETDLEPFGAASVEAVNNQTLKVTFNRTVDFSTAEPNNFTIINGPVVKKTSLSEPAIIRLELEAPLPDGEYTLAVKGVKDSFGNEIDEHTRLDFKLVNPFTLTGINAVSANQLEITFSEEVDHITTDPSHFELADLPNPSSATLSGSDAVLLTFSSALPSGSHTLTVSEIKSMSGWTIAAATEATFFVFDDYEEGDVIINEFMYDPPSGLPEYVELKNTTGKFLDLHGWQVGDEINLAHLLDGPAAFEADSFLVVSPDTASLAAVFGRRNYVQASLPFLNNTEDAVLILNDHDELVDSLFYTSSWGGAGVALERRSATAPTALRANWSDTPHPDGGTPGLPNRVEPDEDPPELIAVTAPTSSTIQLIFSEPLSSGSATEESRYSISPVRTIQLIVAAEDTVTLFLTEDLVSGEEYEVSVAGVEDLFGNELVPASAIFRYVEFSSPDPRDLVINEILYRRLDGQAPEFIELYNNTDKNFDLSGWIVGDDGGSASIPEGTHIEGGAYLVLTDHEKFASSLSNGVYLSGFRALNDAGDAVYLQTDTGITIDSLYYRSSWGGDRPGRSLERKDPGAASNDPANWTSSAAGGGITAGVENSRFEQDESPPEPVFSSLLESGNIEVRFNEFIRLTGGLSFSLDGEELSVHTFAPADGNRIVLGGPAMNAKGKPMNLNIRNLSDVKGNALAAVEFPVSQPIQLRDIVINEIMYHPISDNTDNIPDQSDYIEIRNIRDYAVSLEGIFIHDELDENQEVRSIIPVSTVSKWIPANGVVLIYPEETGAFSESRTAAYFELHELDDRSTIRVERTTLSLNTTGDAVYLADSTGAVIDSVFYSPEWHNPNIIDSRGISLERVNPEGRGNNPSNWGSSTAERGGTPGGENSLFQQPEGVPGNTGITLSPNPFSPDDDGYEDNLFINYKLDQPDFLLRVRVYDRYGRHVRTLTDGKIAGFEGSLIWDGRTGDGRRNRIGIYIVLFEAYDSANGRNRTFKEAVVLARQF